MAKVLLALDDYSWVVHCLPYGYESSWCKNNMSTWSFSSVIQGYHVHIHVYKDIWEAVEGEILDCIRERKNRLNPFAVAVIKQGVIVGHLPKKISTPCSTFPSQWK